MTHFPRHPRGFLVGDAMLALVLALVLLMSFAALVAQQRKAERKLAASRAAVRDVEAALLALQATSTPAPGLRLERLPTTAPAGHAWVRATLEREHAPARPLVALLPLKLAGTPPVAPELPAPPAGGHP